MKVRRHPAQTVFGLASAARYMSTETSTFRALALHSRLWIAAIMYRKEEILAVQTMRNYIMATTVLASTSVAVIFGLAAFLSNLAKAAEPSPGSLFSFTTNNLFGVKILLFMITHAVSFFFLSQSLRFYNHVCVTVNVNVTEEELAKLDEEAALAYEHLDANRVGSMFNRGALFYTMAMRMYYISFPLLSWFAGAWAMCISTLMLLCILRFLDFSEERAPKLGLFKKITGKPPHESTTITHNQSSELAQQNSMGTVRSVEKPRGLKIHKREPQLASNVESDQSMVVIPMQGM
ncbi:hypothetical protein BSLG_003173 [Batrachochytrium salamandrivorans]|nr:hypothetical protein BSLG_003173 [Batrachochytrium salamandrivorans]